MAFSPSPPIEQEGKIVSGEVTLFYHAVIPPHPQAVIVLVHGLSEHGGRYRKLQHELAQQGWASWAYDQRGFGQSTGPRTDIADYNDFLRDLKTITDRVKQAYPALKCGLIGHSLGGLVTAAFCVASPNAVDALVLSAPAYDVFFPPRPLHYAAILLNHIFPTLHVRYPRMKNCLSHDPEVDRAIWADPLVQSSGTPRFHDQFCKMNAYLRQNATAITVPVFILQGTADPVVVPKGAQTLYETIGAQKKKLIFYEGFYHECFNEIGREKVVSDMMGWLHTQISSESRGMPESPSS